MNVLTVIQSAGGGRILLTVMCCLRCLSFLFLTPRQWMVKSRVINDLQEACWDMVSSMAGEIILLLDSDNDGIRTHAIKFVEGLIVTLSPRMADSEVPRRQEHDISLDRIPRDHPYIQYSECCCSLVPCVYSQCCYSVFCRYTWSLLYSFSCSMSSVCLHQNITVDSGGPD